MAFVLLASGVAGCILELVQPGRIAPGVLGLGAAVLGAYSLGQNHPAIPGLTCIGLALLLLTGACSRLYLAAGLISSAILSTGFILLFSAPPRIAPLLAIPLCTGFSLTAAWLIHTALLAYLRKHRP